MSLEEKYKKEDLQNHIYNTPDTYVGGCDLIVETLQIFEPSKEKNLIINFIQESERGIMKGIE